MADEATRAKGRCLCGGVSFDVPAAGRVTAHCHCETCRRAAGAPVVTWTCHRSEDVRILAGAELLRTYESSPGTRRRFCGRCGTPLFFESAKWPGETHVTRVSLEDGAGPAPSRHVFFEHRARFFDDAGTLPKS